MAIYSLINQKGGVGKTTSTINIGSVLAKKGYNVLLIDTDPQGNLSTGIGFPKNQLKQTIYDILINEEAITKAIYKSDIENIHILPATLKLSNAEMMLAGQMERESKLKRAINKNEKVASFYDYILIDTPPSVGILTQNAAVATDKILIPVHTSSFDIEGITHLFNLVNRVKENLNPDLDILGAFISSVDSRRNIIKFKKTLDELFNGKSFKTILHTYSKVEEAINKQTPLNIYDKNSKAAKELEKLVDEILKREENSIAAH
ncbi:MAG: ParA family protein [Candidatus Woesearchaeota archaeon]